MAAKRKKLAPPLDDTLTDSGSDLDHGSNMDCTSRSSNADPCSSEGLPLDPLGSYVVVRPVDESVSFRKINVFWPDKQIRAICGCKLEHETPADGTLVIKTTKASQTKLLLKTTIFCEKRVSVSLHKSRNSIKGTIFAPEIRFMPVQEILDGLREQGTPVSEVYRMTTFRDGKRQDTSLLQITFVSSTLPEKLVVGRLRYDVRPYIPNPLRCYRCQKYGHGDKKCKNEPICKKCGEKSHENACTSAQICISCKATSHSVDSKDCPVWKKEKEICTVKVTKNISYPEARRLVDSRVPTSSTPSYAAVASVKRVTSATQTEKSVSESCGVQTDPIPGLAPLELLPPREPHTSESNTQTPVLPVFKTPEAPVPRVSVTSGPPRDRSVPRATEGTPRSIQSSTKTTQNTKQSQDANARPNPAVKIAMGKQRSHSRDRSRDRHISYDDQKQAEK